VSPSSLCDGSIGIVDDSIRERPPEVNDREKLPEVRQ
jgi:hypothetical protein